MKMTREIYKKHGIDADIIAKNASYIIDETRNRDIWDPSYIQEKINKLQRAKDELVEWYMEEGIIPRVEFVDTEEGFLEKARKQKKESSDFDEESEKLDEKYARQAGLKKLV